MITRRIFSERAIEAIARVRRRRESRVLSSSAAIFGQRYFSMIFFRHIRVYCSSKLENGKFLCEDEFDQERRLS